MCMVLFILTVSQTSLDLEDLENWELLISSIIGVCLILFKWLDWDYEFSWRKSQRWSIIFITLWVSTLNITCHCCLLWSSFWGSIFRCFLCTFTFSPVSKMYILEGSHHVKTILTKWEVILYFLEGGTTS